MIYISITILEDIIYYFTRFQSLSSFSISKSRLTFFPNSYPIFSRYTSFTHGSITIL